MVKSKGMDLLGNAMRGRALHPEHGLMDECVWVDAAGNYEVEEALYDHWPTCDERIEDDDDELLDLS